MSMFHGLRGKLAALALFVFGINFTGAAAAEQFSFVVRNNHPYAVEMQFYSQNRRVQWPGGDEVYVLDDGEVKEIPLACRRGEKICYGAWLSGDPDSYWGVGPGNGERCTDCCYTCNGGTSQQIDLDP